MGLHSLFYSAPATQRRGLHDYALQHYRHDGRKCRNRSRLAMETDYTHSSMSEIGIFRQPSDPPGNPGCFIPGTGLAFSRLQALVLLCQ
jgi:hypothetical protein